MNRDSESRERTGDPRELGARLREARKAASLTQDTAAGLLGVARTTLVAIEKGDRSPRPEEVLQLASLYRRSVNELLQPGEPVSPFAVQLRASLFKDEAIATAIEAPTWEFQRLCERYFELERICGAPMPMNYPPERNYAGAPPEMAGEDLAQRERHRLGIGDGPIPNLRLLLEQDVGLRVFYIALPPNVAAMFSFDPQLGGCIAVNAKQPYERRRLSLAHEYGHFLSSRHRAEVVLLRRYRREPGSERLANAFARCFLMPGDGVRKRVNETKTSKNGEFTNADILSLAHYYGVSVEAFTRRLEELRHVGAGKWERLKASGFRVGDARRLLGIPAGPVEDDLLPPRYRFLALDGYRTGKLTEGQLSRFLGLDRIQVRQLIEDSGQPEGGYVGEVPADDAGATGIGDDDEG